MERSAVYPFLDVSHGAQRSFPLSSRPERSVVERSVVVRTLDTAKEHDDPPPLSSRPERSAVERSAVPRSLPGNVFLLEPNRRSHPLLSHLDAIAFISARPAPRWPGN